MEEERREYTQVVNLALVDLTNHVVLFQKT